MNLKDTFVVPSAGAHPNVSAYHYHNWFAASSSILRELQRSPAHAFNKLNCERKETDAMKIGTATHLAILQPDIFAETVGCAPEGLDRRTKDGKETWAELCEQYGSLVLRHDQYEQCAAMARSVLQKKKASKLLERISEVEFSGAWVDESSGALCKMRLDGIIREHGIIVDIKTTSDATSHEFLKTIFNYGYDRQSAFYMRGCKALNIDISAFVFIVIEKDPPFESAIYEIGAQSVEVANGNINSLLKVWQQCVSSKHWPGYSDEIVILDLEGWMRKRREEALRDLTY